jgi:hypothetical protein
MQDWLHHAALAADPHAADAPRSQSWIEGDAHGYRDGVMFGWFGGAMVGALLAALLVLGGQARGWW